MDSLKSKAGTIAAILFLAASVIYFVRSVSPTYDVLKATPYVIPPTSDPEQLAIPEDDSLAYTRSMEMFKVVPIAVYNVEARLLSVKRYHGTPFSKQGYISPVDFVLGWGPASESQFIGRAGITQRNRWYYYQQEKDIRFKVGNFTANTHIIPATDTVRKSVLSLRVNDMVRLSGYLVKVTTATGEAWVSSRSRTDKGNGACEVLLVTGVSRN